ncbi:MAG: PAS domain-containing protein [Asticcacaulis sp.]|uniref:PAS domain-containing protein n=1 Tax=Asticcacaulis sp. TaxID=1872648 RepID=UPI0039E231D2
MPHSSTVSFLNYWRGLQMQPDKAPLREHFDPARLKALMPQMMMVSTTDHHHRFRLSGGFLRSLHGYDLKDTAFPALFRNASLSSLTTALMLARRRELPVILSLTAPWNVSHPDMSPEELALFQTETVRLEICLCPMLNGYGKVDRMVGLYQTLSPMPRNPNGVLGRYTLEASRLIEPEPAEKISHLRLVTSDGRRIA